MMVFSDGRPVLAVRFLLPGGDSFTQFNMPAVPARGDVIVQGERRWEVEEVAWDLWDLPSPGAADVFVTLRELP